MSLPIQGFPENYLLLTALYFDDCDGEMLFVNTNIYINRGSNNLLSFTE